MKKKSMRETAEAWATHKAIIEDWDDLKGFFDPIEDIKCRQTVRILVKNGKPCDIIQRAKNPPSLKRTPYDFSVNRTKK